MLSHNNQNPESIAEALHKTRLLTAPIETFHNTKCTVVDDKAQTKMNVTNKYLDGSGGGGCIDDGALKQRSYSVNSGKCSRLV